MKTKGQKTENQSISFNKDCVLYYRASRQEQETQRQENDCLEYCKKNGYNVKAIFKEHISGRKRDREQMSRCLEYIRENQIHTLVLSEISRISRSLEGGSILDKLTQEKVCIVSLKEEIKTFNDDWTPNNNHIYLALNAMSNAIKESDYLSYRIKSGKRSKVEYKGSWTGGKFFPYGYTAIDKKMVIDPKEAELVKQIFEKYLSGWGSIKIANWLNLQGIKTKLGANWIRSTINQMLPHRIYIGKRQFKGQEIDTPELRILSDELFQAVQKRMKERKNSDQTFNNLRKYDYLYDRGLMKCGVCGKNYIASIRKEAPEKGIYKCSTGKYSRGCGCESVRVNIVEQVINRFLFKNAFKLLRDNTALHKKSEQINLELSLLRAEQTKANEELKRVNELYIKGRLNANDYDIKYEELNRPLSGLQTKINNLLVLLQEIRQADRVIVNEKYNYVGGKLNLIGTNINKETLHKVIKQITVNKRENKQQIINVELYNGNRFYFDYMLYTKGNYEDVDQLPTIVTGFELKEGISLT